MSGAVAGIISIAALLVGASIVTILVKNPQGTTGLINSTTQGFAADLAAAQGNSTGFAGIPGG